MCLAVPVRIEAIERETALVELGGVRCRVSLLFTPEAQVGDYVITHTGFALSVLDEEEAVETLELLQSMEEMSESA